MCTSQDLSKPNLHALLAAAIVDAIGRRVCSGSKLCLPFGRVGSLVAKDRRLGFQFADGFRRPRMDPAAGQVGQSNVLSVLCEDARKIGVSTPPPPPGPGSSNGPEKMSRDMHSTRWHA